MITFSIAFLAYCLHLPPPSSGFASDSFASDALAESTCEFVESLGRAGGAGWAGCAAGVERA